MNALQDADPDVRAHAAIALGKTGAPAVPALVQALRREAEAGPDVEPAVGPAPRRVRVTAYVTLALADIGKPAVPALVQTFEKRYDERTTGRPGTSWLGSVGRPCPT
jgi:HEAT repeat protein